MFVPQKFMTEFSYFFLESECLGADKCRMAHPDVSVAPPYIYFHTFELCCTIVFSEDKTSLGYTSY